MRLIYGILLFLLIVFIPLGYSYQQDFIDTHYTYRAFVPPVLYNEKDLNCLAQAIYYEAGNQPSLGKEAVAMVVINRYYHKDYPDTICKIVYQSTVREGKKICQFSFTCERLKKPTLKLWRESREIAKRVLQNYYHRVILNTYNSALWFHADYVKPKWSTEKHFVGKIGQHLFYKGVTL